MMENVESWNMALAYYQRIDNILTLCTEARMKGEGSKWFKAIQSLYVEVYPKMTEDQKEDAKEMLDELTKLINEKNKTIPTQKFMALELFIREILEKRGMLTPKRDTAGL